MHAAVEYPDLGMLMWDGGKPGSQGIDSNGSLLPGTKQVRDPLVGPGLIAPFWLWMR